MDVLMPVLVIGGVLASGLAAWILSHRFGLLAGTVLPGLALLGAVWRGSMPLGHAEESMGRGIEVFMVWLPLVALTVIGAGLGLVSRRGRDRKPPG